VSHVTRAGRGSALVAIVVVLLLPALAAGATQEQIDAARAAGLAWLITHQHADGNWKAADGTEAAATATAVEALAAAGIRSYPYALGVSWLGNATLTSVDSLARATQALAAAGIDASGHAERLAAWRNRSQSWAPTPASRPAFPTPRSRWARSASRGRGRRRPSSRPHSARSSTPGGPKARRQAGRT